ncbi:uncharacterized protein Tco025E_05244 [Trypanosoma conorhini]|uniref:Uncharacterized protein n=1 Tax=Trypanosoma conorhini TaxID=83891 RepID=A0A3R7P2L8_9TRYP|nr:uncharacterized protein Tco025E_05244 [Trypanosoma conorhini]RNF16204.1 hypothetical protein Tco025E_05244 [Trypanosoma conorhini]
MDPFARSGIPAGHTGAAQEVSDAGGRGYGAGRAPAAHSVDHVGTLCKVRFIQDDFFCPMYKVAGSSAVYVLLNEGPFSIRLDSEVFLPTVAKLEVNGKLFKSEYRIMANGSRTVKEVHEPGIATTRAFVYHPLVVFDNVLQREVSPDEMELRTIEEADEFTSLFRVLFLPVKGGTAATREGSWKVNYKKEPVAVEMVRIGHRDMLAKLFGVPLAGLVKCLRQASLRKPSPLSRSLSLAPPPLHATSLTARRRSDADSFLPIRSSSSASFSRWASRSTSIERASRPRASSLACFLRSSTGALQACGSQAQRSPSGERRPAARPPSRPRSRPTASRSPKARNKTASAASHDQTPSPLVLRVRPTPRDTSPTLLSLHARENGRLVSTAAAGRESSPFAPKDNNLLDGENALAKEDRKNNLHHICVGCNAVFERERVLFYEIVARLKEKVFALEQENAELRERCEGDTSLPLNCTGAGEPPPATLPVDDLNTTLPPSSGLQQDEGDELDLTPVLTPDLSYEKIPSSEGALGN